MDKLNDSERREVTQFIAEEQRRAAFQQQVNEFTDVCWEKCLAQGKVKDSLDRSDEACLSNCVDRFVDSSKLLVNLFNKAATQRGHH